MTNYITRERWNKANLNVREGLLIYALASEHPFQNGYYVRVASSWGREVVRYPMGSLTLVSHSRKLGHQGFGDKYILLPNGFQEIADYVKIVSDMPTAPLPIWVAGGRPSPKSWAKSHKNMARKRAEDFLSATLRRFLSRELSQTSEFEFYGHYGVNWDDMTESARLLLGQVSASDSIAYFSRRVRRQRLSKDYDQMTDDARYLVLRACGLEDAVPKDKFYDGLTPRAQILLLPELLNHRLLPVHADISISEPHGRRFRVINPTLPLETYSNNLGDISDIDIDMHGIVMENPPQHEHPLESLGECDILKCRTCRKTFVKVEVGESCDDSGIEHGHPLHVTGRGEVFWCSECQMALIDMRPSKWDMWETVWERKALGLRE